MTSTTRSRRLDMHLDDEDEADEVIAAAHYQAHMCAVSRPQRTRHGMTNGSKQDADRTQLVGIAMHSNSSNRWRSKSRLRLERLLLLQSQEHDDTVQQSDPDWDAALMQELNAARGTHSAAPDATAYPYDRSQYPEHWHEWNDAHMAITRSQHCAHSCSAALTR